MTTSAVFGLVLGWLLAPAAGASAFLATTTRPRKCFVSAASYYSSPEEKKALASSENNTASSTTVNEYNDFLPSPNPSLSAVDVVAACMDTLLSEGRDAGLEVCFTFSNDRCRAAIGGSLDNFNEYASNPTFGYLINCSSWKILSVGPAIEGTQHRGSMQTVLMTARAEKQTENETTKDKTNASRKADDDDGRRFLWTLQQERRPPWQGCWMVHEVLYTKNAYLQTI